MHFRCPNSRRGRPLQPPCLRLKGAIHAKSAATAARCSSILQTTMSTMNSKCLASLLLQLWHCIDTQLQNSCCAASDIGSRQCRAGLNHEQLPALWPSVHMLMQPYAALARAPNNCAAMSSFALCRPLAICEHNFQAQPRGQADTCCWWPGPGPWGLWHRAARYHCSHS